MTKVDSVGKKLTHQQGREFNSCCRYKNLFGGLSVALWYTSRP